MGFSARALAKGAVFSHLLPKAYARASAACRVDSRKAVFVSRTGCGLSDNFELMYLRLRDVYGFDVQTVSLHYGEVSQVRYVLNSITMLREIASARYVFLDDASDAVSCVDLRPETEAVQLWHACGAFKEFGMSTAEKRFGGTRVEKERHPYYENLSLFTVSSPEVCWAYREAISSDSGDGVVKPLGVSRTDVFFDERFRAFARELVRTLLLQVGNRRIALYAPTFRGKATSAKGPDRLDVRALKKAIGPDWFLVVKHHPFVKKPPAIPDDCLDFASFAPSGVRIDELLCAADACVTDYSSVIFEYSLLGRPMVFFAYDLDDYDDWRGFYYDYDDMTPGPVVRTNDGLVDALSSIDDWFDADDLASFREKFMASCDGHATERICRAVLEM